jgi:TRAP transporter TAXI family solute receptor
VPVTVSRRTLLAAALAAAAGAATGCTGNGGEPITVAGGELGGFYVEFAQLLVDALAATGTPAVVQQTGGSVENIRRITEGAGSGALGLVLTDIALAALRGQDPFGQPVELCALGQVYENYMQLVVRAEDPVTGIADLAGRPVTLGAVGSGAAVFGDRLLAVAGVRAEVIRRPLVLAVQALSDRTTDALLWSGGVPTPALAQLAERRPLRLLPLAEHLPALRNRYGTAYGPVLVPEGVYGAAAAVPTVGVANLLLAAPTLPDAIADTVVRTLVGAAPRLVPSAALGTQYLDQRSLIDTGDVPLHPGAAAAYRDLHG